MKRLALALLLTVVALTVSIWRAPASVLAGLLTPEITRLAQLHHTTGTIWQGTALFSVYGVPPTLSLAWHCRPSLAPVGVRCELSEAMSASVTIDVFGSKVVAQRVSAAVPVHVVVAGATTASSHTVAATFTDVTASPTALSVKGSVRASDSTYRQGNVEWTLGELTVECTPNAGAAEVGASSSCSISNRGGSARLEGKLSLGSKKASGIVDFTPATGPTQRVNF